MPESIIDLKAVFDEHCIDLLAAVRKGKILHKTKNIRNAGAPFEELFREKMNKFMPRKFEAYHGYLFGPDENCSPQIDIIISAYDQRSSFFDAPDGAHYTPFLDAYAIGEVKNSAKKIEKHLDQIAKTLQYIDETSKAQQKVGCNLIHTPHLSSFVVCGEGKLDIEKITKKWEASKGYFPDWIISIKQGIVIKKPDITNALFSEESDQLNHTEKTIGGCPQAYESSDRSSGGALLWLFFAILSRLNTTDLDCTRQSMASEGGSVTSPSKDCIRDQFSEMVKTQFSLRKILD